MPIKRTLRSIKILSRIIGSAIESASVFTFHLQPFGINDTIGCYVDLDNGSIKFSKNGKTIEAINAQMLLEKAAEFIVCIA